MSLCEFKRVFVRSWLHIRISIAHYYAQTMGGVYHL